MTNPIPNSRPAPATSDVLDRALRRSLDSVTESLGAATGFVLLGNPERCMQKIAIGMEADELAAWEPLCYPSIRDAGRLDIDNIAVEWPGLSTSLHALAGIALATRAGVYMGALVIGFSTCRRLNDAEFNLLRHFSRMIFDQIDLDRAAPKASSSTATHLETAIEKCPASIVVTDAQGRATVWNHATEVNTGYTAEEALGRYSPMTYPDADKLQLLMKRLYQDKSVHRFILPVTHKDGNIAMHGVSAAAFSDAAGNHAGVIALSGDITETLRMQEELELFRTALVHAQDGVGFVEIPLASESRPPIISFVNEALCRITGYTEEELLGSSPLIFHGEETSQDDITRIRSATMAGEPLIIEAKTKRKDGSHIWTELHFTPLPNGQDDGHLRYAIFTRDVSERRELHEAIASSEGRFRSLVQNIREVYTLVDEQGQVLYQSPSVTAATGYSPDELIGKSMFDYIHPDDLVDFHALVQRLLGGEQQTTLVTARVCTKAGGWIWAEGFISDLRADPHVGSVVLNWRDVSELRQLQNQLFMSDRLASLGTLAAGVAHEINNPLTYIMTNLEYSLLEFKGMNQAGYRPQLLTDIEEALTEAKDGAHRVRSIVKNLGAFSRPENDTTTPLDACVVLQKTLNLARNEIRHKAEVVEDYRAIPRVCVNESRLGQVFLNLMVNAAQALPDTTTEDNTIHLSTRLGTSGMVEISVTDNGIGIPAHLHGRIFDPFFSTKPVGHGTGLGLAICHGLVEAMGGKITVNSEEGKGSTFTVFLPPCAEALETETVEFAPADSISRQRVLVIDDEPMIRQAMERLLEDNCDVIMAGDGVEALELLSKDPAYDAILCDLLMPHMTGMDLFERVSYANPALAERFIFITGGAFTPSARAFIDTLTNPILTKPFTERELRQAIHEVNHDQGVAPYI